MTYTALADIYLGDVTSQIYEFLRTPKPSLFLNASRADWRGDESFHHWRYGPVLDGRRRPGRRRRLGPARARPTMSRPRSSGFAASFDLRENPRRRRAAQAIVDALAGGSTADD